MLSFKYGPNLLRYSSSDNILFPSPLLLLLQKFRTLTGL